MPSSDDAGKPPFGPPERAFAPQFGKKPIDENSIAKRIKEESVNNQLTMLRTERDELRRELERAARLLDRSIEEHKRELLVLIEFIHGTGVELTPAVCDIIAELEEKRIRQSVAAEALLAGDPRKE